MSIKIVGFLFIYLFIYLFIIIDNSCVYVTKQMCLCIPNNFIEILPSSIVGENQHQAYHLD
ncbi:MAG: hypothetical protein K6253_03195, partial [Candidatus Liberibacter asiaticus]|nr:hypothetical protein [Candidatus Liberibacter asiaticus]